MKILSLVVLFLLHCAGSGQLQKPSLNPSQTNGSLKYQISQDKLSILSSATQKEFISFPLHKSFIYLGKSNESARYSMASFAFKEDKLVHCMDQTVDSIQVAKDSIQIQGIVSGKDCNSSYTLTLKAPNPKELNLQLDLSDKDINRTQIIYSSSSDEQFFGFGEQYSHFNLKGQNLFIFTEEQGIGRGDQPITFLANVNSNSGGNEFTSYSPIPHYITTKNRSAFFENTAYGKFDLRDDNEVKVQFWENGLKATIWLGENPLELIEKYTAKTGRFPTLPDWAYGTWMGLQGGADKAKAKIKEAKDAGNPVTALWIQDWVGKRTTNFGDQLKWRWYAQEKSEYKDSKGNPEPSYPEFKKFCADMNKDGVKVLGYINSFLADTNPKIPNDPFTNPMLEEAKKKGYLVKNNKGEDYMIKTVGFPAYLIDLTNPEAVKWTKEIIKKNMIDVGLSGWMADFGEWLPYDAVLYDKTKDAKTYHNVYPVDWARINREAIAEAKKEGQIVFFTRAGYSYSNKYSTAFWAGDQMVTFGKDDGLMSTIIALNSSGVSGLAINHSDIGGYTGIKALPTWISPYDRQKELLERWTEANAFTPIFRTHEGNIPARFHQVYTDEAAVKHFATMGKIHYALKEYMAFLSKQATEKGYPMVRHPYLNFPEDSNTFNIKYQYMLGEDLLVLPVIQKGQTSVEGYFPKGSWKHVLTGEIVEGGEIRKVQAPIGQPAAFVKMGGTWSVKIFNSIQSSLK